MKKRTQEETTPKMQQYLLSHRCKGFRVKARVTSHGVHEICNVCGKSVKFYWDQADKKSSTIEDQMKKEA
jgi:hypothetical protein